MNKTQIAINLAYTVYANVDQAMQTLVEFAPLHIAVETLRNSFKADAASTQSGVIVNNSTGAAMIFVNIDGEAVQVSGPRFGQSEGE